MESQKQTQEDKTCKRDDLSKKRQQTYTLLNYLLNAIFELLKIKALNIFILNSDSFPSQSSQLHAVEE